ncbi:MAG: DUF2061 domain-containing protein [Patescibacteria group bacterium]|nr:DUF2061 domain-containing protein [Patescibacteria group bacterium]
MKRFRESPYRSIVKAATFRILIICADSVILYSLTRRVDLTASVLILSNLSSTVFYFAHERIWNKIHWGKKVHENGAAVRA